MNRRSSNMVRSMSKRKQLLGLGLHWFSNHVEEYVHPNCASPKTERGQMIHYQMFRTQICRNVDDTLFLPSFLPSINKLVRIVRERPVLSSSIIQKSDAWWCTTTQTITCLTLLFSLFILTDKLYIYKRMMPSKATKIHLCQNIIFIKMERILPWGQTLTVLHTKGTNPLANSHCSNNTITLPTTSIKVETSAFIHENNWFLCIFACNMWTTKYNKKMSANESIGYRRLLEEKEFKSWSVAQYFRLMTLFATSKHTVLQKVS